jgi:phytoene desaturase
VRTVTGPTDTVVVVGAGLGGLSAALHLAGAGRRVIVLERSAEPGGRAGRLQHAGYTFDTGPTVLTMPDIIEQTLGAVGESLTNWLQLRRLEPAYRATFTDADPIDVHTDPAAMVEQIAATCGPDDAGGYLRFVRFLRELYQTEMPHFIDRNLDSPLALAGAPLFTLLRLGATKRLAAKVNEFVRDERLRRVFTFQSMYAGMDPAQALAIYSVITYMDCVAGVFYPLGGMHALPRALAGAAEKHGVELRYGCTAQRIELNGNRATAVVTATGERIAADCVVVNADRPGAYRELLPGTRARTMRYSPSCVVLHVGARGPSASPHHTISFGHAWQRTFDELIERGELMSDPSFLLTSPSTSDPTVAPTGNSSYYALFPVPHLEHRPPIDWDVEADPYRDHMLAMIEERIEPGFRDRIEVLDLVTPREWQEQGLAAGTPFGAAHSLAQTGPFRPPTLDRRFENVVFCGTNSQPGVGVPMVLISGRLAAERIAGAR